MKVRFNPILGLEEWKAFIKEIPQGVRVTFMRAFTTYIIGDKNHGLKHEPAYKYVSRKSAYGQTFVSEKQRRWFWANGGPDMIGNNRTHEISNAWEMKVRDSSWTHVSVENGADGVGWVMGLGQARQPAKVGWRDILKVIQDNMTGAMNAAQDAVNDWLKGKV